MTESDHEAVLKAKIRGVLKIYPKLSNSMLQAGIGPSIPSAMWKPVLQRMIDNNEIIIETIVDMSVSGRRIEHKVIQLAYPNDPVGFKKLDHIADDDDDAMTELPTYMPFASDNT